MKNNRYHFIVIVFALAALLPNVVIAAYQAPPALSVRWGNDYYRFGGGEVVPPPGAVYRSFAIRARLLSGFNYSCGKFNFQNNIAQMINQFKTKVREIPGQLQSAVQAAIAGLPGYLMMKYNPTLYNVLTKTLDASTTLFRLSYKSCETMQNEMSRHPGSNPYASFMQASVLNTWSTDASKGKNIADTRQDIKTTPGKPIPWFDGQSAGSASHPLDINRDVVVAGYNLMIGRVNNLMLTTAPTGTMAQDPVVQIWPTPTDAGKWIKSVVGGGIIVLDHPKTIKPESSPGNGLRPDVKKLTGEIRDALQTAYDTSNFYDINKYTSARISGGLINGLRSMQPGQAALMMNHLASEMAVNEVQERVFLMFEMMSKALNSPDIAASPGGPTAKKYIKENTFPSLERMLKQIHDDIALKRNTVNQTTIKILNLSEHIRNKGLGGNPGAVRNEPSYIDGGVKR